jgi:hypothetical protein
MEAEESLLTLELGFRSAVKKTEEILKLPVTIIMMMMDCIATSNC